MADVPRRFRLVLAALAAMLVAGPLLVGCASTTSGGAVGAERWQVEITGPDAAAFTNLLTPRDLLPHSGLGLLAQLVLEGLRDRDQRAAIRALHVRE